MDPRVTTANQLLALAKLLRSESDVSIPINYTPALATKRKNTPPRRTGGMPRVDAIPSNRSFIIRNLPYLWANTYVRAYRAKENSKLFCLEFFNHPEKQTVRLNPMKSGGLNLACAIVFKELMQVPDEHDQKAMRVLSEEDGIQYFDLVQSKVEENRWMAVPVDLGYPVDETRYSWSMVYCNAAATKPSFSMAKGRGRFNASAIKSLTDADGSHAEFGQFDYIEFFRDGEQRLVCHFTNEQTENTIPLHYNTAGGGIGVAEFYAVGHVNETFGHAKLRNCRLGVSVCDKLPNSLYVYPMLENKTLPLY